MHKDVALVPPERIERSILLIRGQKVMLARDLAYLYGVPTKVLNQAVKRHGDRFPEDFMFQLTMEEARIWWEQVRPVRLRSQFVTLKRGQHIKYRPYAFTEHGILMLSSVLNSDSAVQVNIEIMRTFVRLRRILASHSELARKLDALEKKYDAQFKIVFDAIRELMKPPESKKRPIGFLVEEPKVPYTTKNENEKLGVSKGKGFRFEDSSYVFSVSPYDLRLAPYGKKADGGMRFPNGKISERIQQCPADSGGNHKRTIQKMELQSLLVYDMKN